MLNPIAGKIKKRKINFSQNLVANQNLVKRIIKAKRKTKFKKRLNIGSVVRKDIMPINII